MTKRNIAAPSKNFRNYWDSDHCQSIWDEGELNYSKKGKNPNLEGLGPLGNTFPLMPMVYRIRLWCPDLTFDIELFVKHRWANTMQIIVRRIYLNKYNIFKMISPLLWVMILLFLELHKPYLTSSESPNIITNSS